MIARKEASEMFLTKEIVLEIIILEKYRYYKYKICNYKNILEHIIAMSRVNVISYISIKGLFYILKVIHISIMNVVSLFIEIEIVIKLKFDIIIMFDRVKVINK